MKIVSMQLVYCLLLASGAFQVAAALELSQQREVDDRSGGIAYSERSVVLGKAVEVEARDAGLEVPRTFPLGVRSRIVARSQRMDIRDDDDSDDDDDDDHRNSGNNGGNGGGNNDHRGGENTTTKTSGPQHTTSPHQTATATDSSSSSHTSNTQSSIFASTSTSASSTPSTADNAQASSLVTITKKPWFIAVNAALGSLIVIGLVAGAIIATKRHRRRQAQLKMEEMYEYARGAFGRGNHRYRLFDEESRV